MGHFTILRLTLATWHFSLAVPVQQICLVTDQIVSWERHFTECLDTAMHIQLDTMMPLCPQIPLHPVNMNFFNHLKVLISMFPATKNGAQLIYAPSGNIFLKKML